MVVGQHCEPQQLPPVRPDDEMGSLSLNQDLILETLNLQATAVQTALRRLLALEGQMKEMQVKVLAAQPGLLPAARPAGTGFVPSRFDVVHRAPVLMTIAERVVLYGLVVGLQPERCLEIGTCQGGSAMITVAALDDLGAGSLSCVDPNPLVKPEHWRAIAHRATLFQAPSPGILPIVTRAAGGKFDFALIDGDHSTAGVVRDTEGVLPHLENKAYLLFHDAYNSEVAEGIAIALRGPKNCLVNCGMVSTERTVDSEHGVLWGGLQLLRVSR